MITKETKLDKILEIEGVEEILLNYKVPCLSCPYAKYELAELNIGFICERYNIDSDKLIDELNKKAEEK
ncbi:MAG: hypothetical protein WC472_03255 [Candidatus Paceibacterota bacterium]|jgi:hypothetical protein